MKTLIVENESELIRELAALIERVSNESVRQKDSFTIGLSGGSLVKFLAKGLPTIKTDYRKWKVFFCDERVVPEDDPESTFGVYKRELLDKIELKEEQFIKIKQGVSANEAAEDYISQMKQYFKHDARPKIDMLLLGMGPDGHTCSLFPGHKLLEVTDVWVAPITDSPKPPPSRITLTFPVINNATYCVFAIAGEGKAEMIKKILVDKEDLPATRVAPKSDKLYWILDKGAAKLTT